MKKWTYIYWGTFIALILIIGLFSFLKSLSPLIWEINRTNIALFAGLVSLLSYTMKVRDYIIEKINKDVHIKFVRITKDPISFNIKIYNGLDQPIELLSVTTKAYNLNIKEFEDGSEIKIEACSESSFDSAFTLIPKLDGKIPISGKTKINIVYDVLNFNQRRNKIITIQV